MLTSKFQRQQLQYIQEVSSDGLLYVGFFSYICASKKYGEVLERFKRYAWKAYVLQKGTGGSNPFLSAK